MIDVNEIRDPVIAINGLHKANDVYTIYYDETNNIRRLHVTPSGLNVREPECFVLGGIAHKGVPRDLEFETLRSKLRLQKTAQELKRHHLGKGNFLQLFASPKVADFLEWIIDHNLFVHFQVLDTVYWSIVDVVDSILTEAPHRQLIMCAPGLKDDLYTILRHDLNRTVDLFQRYSYPDVGRDKRHAFIKELLEMLEDKDELLSEFNFYMLKGLLQMATTLESLPYLEDEKPNILIDAFSIFYVQRICLLKNSHHILDIEEVIKSEIADETFFDNGCPLQNYKFVDSRNEHGVQIADAVTGLLGKFFTFLNRTPLWELNETRLNFSRAQSRSLALLATLIDRSIAENAAFAGYMLSHEDRQRSALLLETN
jgi:hypothetical protein